MVLRGVNTRQGMRRRLGQNRTIHRTGLRARTNGEAWCDGVRKFPGEGGGVGWPDRNAGSAGERAVAGFYQAAAAPSVVKGHRIAAQLNGGCASPACPRGSVGTIRNVPFLRAR